MAFIINSNRISFADYKLLLQYKEDYPVCEEIVSFMDKWTDSSVNSFEFLTSGSTGISKRINHSRKSLIRSAELTKDYFGYGRDDNALLCLPLNFIAGTMMLVRAVVSHLNLIIGNLSSFPLDSMRKYRASKIHFAAMTPMQLENSILSHPDELKIIDKILLGGAPVSFGLSKRIQSLPIKIFLGFGMTETITHIAVRALNGKEKQEYFKALPGVNFDTSKDGCLIINAIHLNERLITNDVVDLQNQFQFKWLGRRDNVINSGGLKISPEEIEAVLSKSISLPLFVFGKKDEILGESLALVLESKSVSGFDIEKLKLELLSLDLKARRPKLVYVLEKFVYTPTNKIDRLRTINAVESINPQKL